MRRIAFLSFDWDYKVVTEYYLGLQEHLKDRRDVQVVIFNAYGYYYASHVHRESHLDIFGAVNLADFDALLIQGNRTWPPNLRQEVVDRARELNMPVLDNDDVRRLLFSVINQRQRVELEENRELDFALSVDFGKELNIPNSRFRVNAFFQRGTLGMVASVVNVKIPTPAQLGLPEVVSGLCSKR